MLDEVMLLLWSFSSPTHTFFTHWCVVWSLLSSVFWGLAWPGACVGKVLEFSCMLRLKTGVRLP